MVGPYTGGVKHAFASTPKLKLASFCLAVMATASSFALTTIRTRDTYGSLTGGIDVYVNGEFKGKSGVAGVIFLELKQGDTVAARYRATEVAHNRGFHSFGSNQDWAYRVYYTNVKVNPNGTSTIPTVTNPAQIQEIKVSANNVLIGLNWGVCLEWDANSFEMDGIRDRMKVCSDYLFNATDGQFFIEHVWIADNYQQRKNADAVTLTDFQYRANVRPYGLGFLQVQNNELTYMKMNRTTSGTTYAHEFGHYGLGLGDEYKDEDPNVICTELLTSKDPNFSANNALAACMMYQQKVTSKICSSVGANPHNYSISNTDCWTRIAKNYEKAIQFEPTPVFQTPGRRGQVVKTIQKLFPSWSPTFQVFDQDQPDLVKQRVLKTSKTGGVAERVTVLTYELASNRFITQGKVWIKDWEKAGENELTLTGLHVGDWVYVPQTYFYYVAPDPESLPIQMDLNPTHLPVQIGSQLLSTGKKVRFTVKSLTELSAPPEISVQVSTPEGRVLTTPLPSRQTSPRDAFADFDIPNVPGQEFLVVVKSVGVNRTQSTEIRAFSVAQPKPGEFSQATSHDGSVRIRFPAERRAFPSSLLFGPSDRPMPSFRGWDVYETPMAVQGPPTGMAILSTSLIFTIDEDETSEFQIVRWDEYGRTWRFLPTTTSLEAGVVTTLLPLAGHYALLRKSTR